MNKIKLKYIGSLTALVLSSGIALCGCKSNSESNIKFTNSLEENADNTCLDEHLETSTSLKDNIITLQNYIDIYKITSNLEFDEKLETKIEKEENKDYLKELSVDDIELLKEEYQNDSITNDERNEIGKKLILIKNNCNDWLLSNGDNIIESLSLAVLKCSTLDAMGLSEEDYNNVKILSQNSQAPEDNISFAEDGKKAKTIFSVEGDMNKLLTRIYSMQSTDPNKKEKSLEECVENWNGAFRDIDSILNSDKEVKKSIFGNEIKLK